MAGAQPEQFAERPSGVLGRVYDVIVGLVAIVGVLSTLFVALVSLGKPLGDLLDVLAKPLDSLLAPRYRPPENGPAPTFVYYERGSNGAMTAYGQLRPLGGASLPEYRDLKVGQKLQSNSSVYLRYGDGRDKALAETLPGGSCLTIKNKVREIPNVQNASSGGWLQVEKTPCS